MPSYQPYASIFRGGDFHYTGYIGTIPHTVVIRRAVNMASITYPVLYITMDNPDGEGGDPVNDVQVDMLVKVYDGETTRVKGYLRVAYGGAASATQLHVSEFSAVEVDLADNDRFEVIDAYRIQDKLVSATDEFNKDSRIAYVAQGANPPPVANGGGLWFGHVDKGQVFATVEHDSSTSFYVDPDSSTALDTLWIPPDGTVMVGGLTTPQITLQYPIGFRHMRQIMYDTDNSTETQKLIPVHVFDYDTHPALAVRMVRRRSTKRAGWSIQFELPAEDEGALDDFPDGCLIVYWEHEERGAIKGSYGSEIEDRSHIKFVGYLIRDSIHITAEGDTLSFEATNPMELLKDTAALNQLMVQKASPLNWWHIKTLTLNRALWYLAYWHSTLFTYFDFLWATSADLGATAYKRLAVDNIANLADQLRDIASAVNLDMTCDMLGRLMFPRKLQYQPMTERDVKEIVLQVTVSELLELNMTREHRGRVKFVQGLGVNSAGAVFESISGAAPASYGTAVEVLDRQIVADQADLNERTAFHFYYLNGLYYGVFTPQDVSITLPDSYDIFDPAYPVWLIILLDSSYNRRRVGFTLEDRWTIEEVEVSYDEDGGKLVTLIIDHETYGEAVAVTQEEPVE